MPTIKMTDRLGAVLNVEAAPASALLRYFHSLPAVAAGNLDLSQAGGLTLDDPAVRSFTTGVDFTGGGGTKGVDLTVHAVVRGGFAVADSPGYAGARCTRLSIDASAAGPACFGVEPGASVEFTHSLRFAPAHGVTLAEALTRALGGFQIPARTADLEAMPEGSLATVTGAGSLKLSASADLLAIANPLAVAKLPGPIPAVGVTAGGDVRVGGSIEIRGEFQIRAQRVDARRVRVAWHRKKSEQWTVEATASAGVSAGLGQMELFSAVLGAVSANPAADTEALKRAGLSQDQTESIEAAVKSAVARRLELALTIEMSALESDAAAFHYELDLPALDAAARSALDRALHGDLSALEGRALAGISRIQSIWTRVRARRLTLEVNLLGIYNFASVAELVRTGTVLSEPATGALVLTDRVTADRVRSAQVNFGADTEKLRQVLAESFLITAVYRGSVQAVGTPSLTCRHSFFVLRNDTSRPEMLRSVRIGTALGLWTGDPPELPAGAGDFGRTTVHAQTDYDDALASGLFLGDDGAPGSVEFYENAGRAAIQLLVAEQDPDAVRRRPAIDDDLWRKMKRSGQPGFRQLFPNLPAPLLGAIVADYSTIVWWADAMEGAARRLAAMRRFLSQNPAASAQDSGFLALREDLAAHLEKVAAKTREEFGQPWGLVAMHQASARRASASILILCPRLVLAQASAKTISAG